MFLNYLLIVLIVFIGVVPMVHEVYTRRFDFFNAKNPFLIYYLIQLAVSGLVTLQSGTASSIGLDPIQYASAYTKALIISALGLVAFQLGYYYQRTGSLHLPVLLRKSWRPRRYLGIVWALILIGMIAFFLIAQINGGLSSLLANREEFRAGGMVGQGFLIFPATAGMALAALLYLAGRVKEANKRKKPIPIINCISVLLLSLVPAFFLGFRSALILPVLQFMVVWNYGYRHLNHKPILLLTSVIVISFTLYGISREIPLGVSLSTAAVIEAVAKNPEVAYDVVSRSKGTEVLATVINKLEETGDYEMGWRSLLEAVTIFIPKKLWSDKPLPSSQRFTTYFFGASLAVARGYDMEAWGGISPTVVGEFYWNFGVVGVIIGLYIFGRIYKLAYSTLKKHQGNHSVVVVYAIIYTSAAMFAEAVQGYVNGLVLHIPILVLTFAALTLPVFAKLKNQPLIDLKPIEKLKKRYDLTGKVT